MGTSIKQQKYIQKKASKNKIRKLLSILIAVLLATLDSPKAMAGKHRNKVSLG